VLCLQCAQTQTDPEAAPRHSGSLAGTDMGPVFIPIVLAMDPLDHRTLLEDWLRQQTVRLLCPRPAVDSTLF